MWRPTRPVSRSGVPGVCGYVVRPGRICNRPATWHLLMPHTIDCSHTTTANSCDRHLQLARPLPIDTHPHQDPCRLQGTKWHYSQGHIPGFCYDPEEDQALHEALAATQYTGDRT